MPPLQFYAASALSQGACRWCRPCGQFVGERPSIGRLTPMHLCSSENVTVAFHCRWVPFRTVDPHARPAASCMSLFPYQGFAAQGQGPRVSRLMRHVPDVSVTVTPGPTRSTAGCCWSLLFCPAGPARQPPFCATEGGGGLPLRPLSAQRKGRGGGAAVAPPLWATGGSGRPF